MTPLDAAVLFLILVAPLHWLQAWREEEQARLLARLDERLLRDIGLDAGSGDPLAARADAYGQQGARRIAMARLGLM